MVTDATIMAPWPFLNRTSNESEKRKSSVRRFETSYVGGIPSISGKW